MFWNRESCKPGYLFLMRYKEDQGSGGADGQSSDEWQGKMRALKNQIYDVQSNLGNRIVNVEDKVKGVEREVKNIRENVTN